MTVPCCLPGDLVQSQCRLTLFRGPDHGTGFDTVSADSLLLVVGWCRTFCLVAAPLQLGWLPLTSVNIQLRVVPVGCTGHTEAPT